ncbi:hypothetical protein Pcal_1251 [Pyrobaculum calidifontis JCM 11548]|uniref:Uncharacterized protein n=1 Tax=Pyrobaculum calidifontis (strain DSM 21063 / JCM 11548 / VA1) TaxID=410359 RepID=A3MVK8_PYRCJ|nr:hypothetical protein Pcal_1251 [Pyrobaculum calidifontis JCM 11548]
MASSMGSGRGNSGRILFWSLVLIGLAVLGFGIGLLVGQATVGASIGLGLILILMVYLREGPARGRFGAVFSLGLSAFFLALGAVQLLGLAKAERVVVDALFIVMSNITFLWWGVSAVLAKASQS